MNLKPKIVVEDLNPFQAKVLKFVGYLVGVKGDAFIAFVQYGKEEVEPTINDIVKNNEEDAMNRVSTNN